MLQKGLHAEIGQGRTEKYGGKLTGADLFLIKLRAGPVQELNVF